MWYYSKVYNQMTAIMMSAAMMVRKTNRMSLITFLLFLERKVLFLNGIDS
jgi:hypothetical protein